MSANPNPQRKMTVQQARKVRYPFYDHPREPMGILIDNGEISFPELLNLIQKSNVPRIVEAATVLLEYLTQEQNKKSASPAGIVKVVSSERRSFAEVRQIQWTLILGVFIGFILGCLSSFMLYNLLRDSNTDNSNMDRLNTLEKAIVYLSVIGIVVSIWFISSKIFEVIAEIFFRQVDLHRKGQLGEKRVLNVMYRVLDGNWHVFQNLELPGIKVDIDLVLVGPAGVLSLEVKAFSGSYRNIGDTWQRRWQKQWLPAIGNPGHQSRYNAKKLNRFFENNQIKQWVEPIIVWADPNASLELENPTTHIWQLDNIGEHLKLLPPKNSFSPEQRERIITVLKEHYEKMEAARAE